LKENDVEMNVTNYGEENAEEEFVQDKGLVERTLTEEELVKLSSDKELASEFKRRKLELEAKKNWDLFYRRNKNKFFKDRYWTFREFDELNADHADVNDQMRIKTLLEIGCGVGNFVYPLIKQNKEIFAYVCDFSSDAVQLLKQNPDFDTSRMLGFVCDATKPRSLADALPTGVKVDVVTLIFVLSAIHPDKMRLVVRNIADVVRPGGIVMIRGMVEVSKNKISRHIKLGL
jgi:methyltransferase-like protein 6